MPLLGQQPASNRSLAKTADFGENLKIVDSRGFPQLWINETEVFPKRLTFRNEACYTVKWDVEHQMNREVEEG
jgi:hypothetical protein